MPRVKVDYIFSVSSEDPENPANNLLAGEVSKKKWLCSKGEQTCSVVLQLCRAVTISAIHIGAHHSAFVEVLVGSSEKPVDQYEVLVARCVFVPPAESRRGPAAERVRSFAGEQLQQGARGARWDRVRLLCEQPYNRHCQFGLSFVHIYEPEAVAAAASPPPTAAALAGPGLRDNILALGNYSSDEDDFRPGELFSKHRPGVPHGAGDAAPGRSADAQIRRATTQALNNVADADTKLKKISIAKSNSKREESERRRGHATSARAHCRTEAEKNNDYVGSRSNTRCNTEAKASGSNTTAGAAAGVGRKRQRSGGDEREGKRAACGGDERDILRGVVFAMSGYVNPERAALRDAGLALGARYRPDWTADCTHLVCAFPNTPKLKKVVDSVTHAQLVSGAWLQACRQQRRRVPEALHAMHPRTRAAPPPAAPPPSTKPVLSATDSDDTDDEIQKVRERDCAAPPPSAPPPPRPLPHDDDVVFVCDARFKGSLTILDNSDEETTEEEVAGDDEDLTTKSELPDFLEGLSFVIAEEVEASGFDVQVLGRYVRAYGGLLLNESQLDEGSTVDYVLCTRPASSSPGGTRLRPDWLWRCHEMRALAPTHHFAPPY